MSSLPSPGPEIRTVTEDDFPDWVRAMTGGFLRSPEVTDKEVRLRREGADLTRTLGAFDGGRCVGTFRSFPQELTVPGGAPVAADAISNVTVAPTHRRRGLLSRMMADDLARARERGDVLATLIAAEYPIYGRYGFGPAAWTSEWRVEVARAGLDPRWSGPPDGGRVDFADPGEVRKLGPGLHERLRARRHGVIDRNERFWRLQTGEIRFPGIPWKDPFHAVYRDPEGRVDGLISYTVDDSWDGTLPNCTASVRDCLAVSPAAERALWHFLLSVDWVKTVKTGERAPDDLLPSLLPDARAARIATYSDFMWIRLLDVPRALEARTYPASASLVLEVHEPDGAPHGRAASRYRLDASPDGASCTPTTANPDLVLSASDLGSLYLGGESAERLLALGRVSEEREGAAARTDLLMRTARRPWCPDIF